MTIAPEREQASSGRPDARPSSKELMAIARNFKQGYRFRRTSAGHFRVVDRNGEDVTLNGRAITVSGNPSPGVVRAFLDQVTAAQIVKGSEPRPMTDALKAKRDQAIRQAQEEASRRRQEETNALRERYTRLFKPMKGLDVPGLAGDLGAVASYLLRGTPDPITPDLLVGSAHRTIVHGAPGEKRYLDVWRMLIERLENATDSVGEWFNLVRDARGLPADTVQLRLPKGAQDEWPFRVELLPLDALLVDDSYQRPPGWAFVRKEAARFDPSLVGTIDVAQRSPSRYAILDGQQRVEIVRLVGKETVWASIYVGLDVASEARFFLHKNAHRKNMHPYYTFRASVTSNDPDSNAIEAIVERHGYKLSIGAPQIGGGNANHIAAIAAVIKAYSRKLPDGSDALDPTLAILKRSTFGREEGQSAMMIRGLSATLLDRPDFDEGQMVGVISDLGPTLLLGRARDVKRASSTTSEEAISRVILSEYDSRRRRAKRAA